MLKVTHSSLSRGTLEQWRCAWVFGNDVTANYLCFLSVHESLSFSVGQFAGQLLLLLDKFLLGHRIKFIENECCSKEVLVCLHGA